jgi:hypothetical protein
MQLDQYQRRALLYRTEKVFYNGEAMAEIRGIDPIMLRHSPSVAGRRHKEASAQPFLGDILPKDLSWITKCRNIGRRHAQLAADVVEEVTGIPLGTQLDERTAEAFAEAKAALAAGKRPEDAWPQWYIQGKNPPRKRSKK